METYEIDYENKSRKITLAWQDKPRVSTQSDLKKAKDLQLLNELKRSEGNVGNHLEAFQRLEKREIQYLIDR